MGSISNLLRLQEATHPGSADAPGFRLHPLKGAGRASGACAYPATGVSYSVSRTAKPWTWTWSIITDWKGASNHEQQ